MLQLHGRFFGVVVVNILLILHQINSKLHILRYNNKPYVRICIINTYKAILGPYYMINLNIIS